MECSAQASPGGGDRRDTPALVGSDAYVQKKNLAAWEKYKAKGVQIILLSETDIQKFRWYAIPMWFKWAKRDPLARETFASQFAFMKDV